MPQLQLTTCNTFRLLLTSTVMVFAMNATAVNDRVGEVEALADNLSFYPEVDYQQLELTVAGSETRWQQTFGPNEIAEFSLLDQPLADGQYRYELIASPPVDQVAQEVARNDRELLQALDRLERDSTFRQIGRFEIVGGKIVLLDDAENLETMKMSGSLRKGEAQ